jgi:hypothetical protein
MQRDKTLSKKCLSILITFTLMFIFRNVRVRRFYEADAGNGGGQGGDGGQPAGDAAANPNPNPNPADPGKTPDPKPDNSESAMRYQISREREWRQKAEAELRKFQETSKTQKPVFDEDSDPDGSKERRWEAEQIAQELFQKNMKDLGLDEKLSKIQYEKEEKEFFEVVAQESEKFKQFGIEAPTKEQLKTILTTIDQKGITPEQIIMLAQSQKILESLKPAGFVPWNGPKPNTDKPRTEAEIRNEIYAAHGAFWK